MPISRSKGSPTKSELVAELLSDQLPTCGYQEIHIAIVCIGIEPVLNYLSDINVSLIETPTGLRLLVDAPQGDTMWAYLKLLTLMQHLMAQANRGF